MKLSERKLKRIIREEVRNHLNEARGNNSLGGKEQELLTKAVNEALNDLYRGNGWKAVNMDEFGVGIMSPHKRDEVAYVILREDQVVLEDFYQGKFARIDISGGVRRNYDRLIDRLVYYIEEIQTEEEHMDPRDRNPYGI